MLLLQGPRGLFFSRFGRYLRREGITVYKINFNGGDTFFYPWPDALSFRGSREDWEVFLEDFVDSRQIDCIYLFGDCRFYHQTAIKVANRQGIAVFVFEEGYIRPDYITLEKFGVNGHSQIPCNRSSYECLSEPVMEKPLPARNSFFRMAFSAVMYHLAELLMRWHYRHYQYHKEFSFLKEPLLWVRSGIRKVMYRIKERHIEKDLIGRLRKRYFFVPLQVFNDAQISFHSKYSSVEQFIAETIQSFAEYAGDDHFLIVKHHPMDRGHKDYAACVHDVAKKFGVHERVIYIHDLHLPTLLKNALGVVVINSTVGLSSLHHGTPLKVMGTAIYDLPGLTYQTDLAAFWRNPGKVNREIYKRFRGYIVEHTQLNGGYYGMFPFDLKKPVTQLQEVLLYDTAKKGMEHDPAHHGENEAAVMSRVK